MQGLELISVGGALPRKTVTNDDLARIVETSDEWVYSRSGIHSRHFCSDDESAVTLALEAARMALAKSGIAPKDIDCCICATVASDHAVPSMACELQAALELRDNIPSFDLGAACSGFLYSLTAAYGLLATTGGKYALVVGCEQLSRLLDMNDRTTCVLFGDGAGAAVVRLSEDTLYASTLGSRGGNAIEVEGAGPETAKIKMDGKAVFRFAVEALPRCVNEIFEKTGLGFEDVDQVICHQANIRILQHAIRTLKAPAEKFFVNLDHTGNTSAASVPLALWEMDEKGLLKPDSTLLCVAFGGGLTWAGVLLKYRGGVHNADQ